MRTSRALATRRDPLHGSRVTPWGHHGDAARASVDDTVVVHRITKMSFPACGPLGIMVCTAIAALRWPDTGLCTIHSPYYFY